MSRMLIGTVLMVVLPGLAPVLPMPVLPGAPIATGVAPVSVSLTGTAIRPGHEDSDEQPRRSVRRFGWPLPGTAEVVRRFDPPVARYGPGHRGVDLAAAPGTPVLAAGAGTVVFAGTLAGRGVVSVDHPGGLRTTYEPVSATVSAGDRVSRGEQIGTLQVGHPGCAAAACLHWGVLRGPARDGNYLDPLHLLATARVRLLPIEDPGS